MPVISTNTAANTALRYLNENSSSQSENLSRIASGSRITKASDDASGLAIGTKLNTDVATLSQAETNVSNGISILSVADGGLSSISDILERMKTLATQSVSGTVTNTERAYIDAEYDALVAEITSIAGATTFNGSSLLGTSGGYSATFQSGTETTDTLTVSIAEISTTTLTDGTTTIAASGVDSEANAQLALSSIDGAIDVLSTARANVGAQMSRFEFREATLATSVENTKAAVSSIMDADIAAEQAALASNEVLTQAAIAALASANELPQNLLDLLR